MSARAFVDTNVWVYAEDADEPVKRDRARNLLRELLSRDSITVSAQVLGEYFVTMRRRFAVGLDVETAERRVATIADGSLVVDTSAAIVSEAIRGVRRHGLSFYDAQIWAAAKGAGAHVVLSEDFDAGAELEGVRFIDPVADGFDLEAFVAEFDRGL
jgi:predicted nucleic acid-binding protein